MNEDSEVDDPALPAAPGRPPAISAELVTPGDDRPRGCGDGTVERADGHLLVVPNTGAMVHVVDFVEHRAGPGSAIHVQPGQVHRWRSGPEVDATVVMIASSSCPAGLFDPATPRPLVDFGPAADVVDAVCRDLVREQGSSSPSRSVMAASALLLVHQLARAGGRAGVEEHAAAEPHNGGGSQLDLLTAFRTELEGSFALTRSVGDYARRIGTSQKTLSRATATLVGSSPKEIIDRRVILEARRLLAHSDESASAIGSRLGFSEPTNFTKFFVRHTGMSPQEFRLES